MGERTPGGVVAGEELLRQRATPAHQQGTVQAMSLPASEMLVLWRKLTGNATPHVAWKLRTDIRRTGRNPHQTVSPRVSLPGDFCLRQFHGNMI